MKKKLLTKLLPVLLSVCMIAGTVSAAELPTADVWAEIAEETQTAVDEAALEEETQPSEETLSDEILSDEIASDEIVSDEIVSDEIVSDEIVSGEIDSDEVDSDEVDSDEVVSGEVVSDEVASDEIVSDEVISEEIILDSEDGRTENADTLISNDGYKFTVSWNGNAIITGRTHTSTKFTIPAKLTCQGKNYNVEGLGDSAFSYEHNIIEITIADGITYIGNNCFQNCSGLKKVSIPGTVETIDNFAFDYCKSLETLSLGSGVTSIGLRSFANCPSLRDFTFPNTLETIGVYAFGNDTSLGSVVLPKSLKTLDRGAFCGCETLTMVYVPGSVKTIGTTTSPGNNDGVFQKCPNLTNVTLVNGIETLGYYTFNGCTSLKTIKIPASVTEINWSFGDRGINPAPLTVYVTEGSEADNASHYPNGTVIKNGSITVAAPTFKETMFIGGRDLTLSCTNKEALIYYSTSQTITLKDKFVTPGSRIEITNSCTIYAKAYFAGKWSSLKGYEVKVPTLKAPAISQIDETVTVSTSSEGCTIYYTTDGSQPTIDNGKAINASKGTFKFYKGTVKAIAVKNGYKNSAVSTAAVGPVISSKLAPPSFAVKGVFNGRDVTFNSVAGSKVYYKAGSSSMRIADTNVKAGSTVQFADFYGTIYARTYKDHTWSNPARLILKIPVCNAPTITRETQRTYHRYTYGSGGYYTTDTTPYINIKTSTPSCYIVYTTDGTQPSLTNGKRVTGSSVRVYAGYGHTVKAIAIRSCFTNSKTTTFYD